MHKSNLEVDYLKALFTSHSYLAKVLKTRLRSALLMKMKLFSIILGIFISVGVVSGQSPRVTVNEGDLVGKTLQFSEDQFINVTKNVDVFLGVPFASPPVRFSPPQPMTPWEGVRNATQFSPACQQASSPYMSEDCLYLNVYAPSPKLSGIPVMVWIHGGGFSFGSAMTYEFYGLPLVSVGDVIIVAINYRLGIFAQFSTEDAESPGNYGMLDQVAALEWIYNNIEAFGGDKEKITIFGESAGAASVSFHLLSELSRGYYRQAILQSGTAFSGLFFRNNPDYEVERAQELGRALGCADVMSTSALVSCLRDVEDPDALRSTADAVYSAAYPVTLDGTFLKDTPTRLHEMDKFDNVPMLIGFNRDEGTLLPYFVYTNYIGSETPPPINLPTFEGFITGALTSNRGTDDEIVFDAVFQEYIDWTMADNPTNDYARSLFDFGTDFDFACPADYVVREHLEANGTVYKYFFTHAPSVSFTPWLGAGHAEEIQFVWGHAFIDELFTGGQTLTDEEKAFSVSIMQFWTNFVKTGDPSKSSVDGEAGVGEDYWPLYTLPELQYKELSLDLGEVRAVRARQCHFWNTYLPDLEALTNTVDEDTQEWRKSYTDWQGELNEWQKAFEKYQELPGCN